MLKNTYGSPTFTGLSVLTPPQKMFMPLRSIRLPQFLAHKTSTFFPKADKTPATNSRICGECSKIDLSFFRKGSRHRPPFSGIKLNYDRSSNCGFCALVQHCVNQSDIVDPRLLGELRGVRSGHELHLCAGDKNLDYSIQRCEPKTRDGFNHLKDIPDRYAPTELMTWLEKCDQHKCLPDEHSSATNQKLPAKFRLIDVERRCIVTPKTFVEYCALSYVWGSANHYFLTKSSEKELACDGGIDKVQRLPQTILDAVDLCREIGRRYLWVDSLCIIQDDEEDRRRQIHSMAEIYSQSYLTIIAAAGDDADAGLPPYGEFGRLPPNNSLVVDIPGLGRFVASRSPQIAARNIINSTWASRGWTLQEQILSRRVLFFTGAHVFLRCEHSLWNEDMGLRYERNYFEYSEMQEWDLPLPAFYRRKSMNGHIYSSTFKQILGEYLRRQQNLTMPTDVLNAITGILVRLRDEIGEHLWGLPSKRFASALMWNSERPCPSKRRSGFPSWSWAGWFHERQMGKSYSDSPPQDVYGNDADDDVTNQSAILDRVQSELIARSPSQTRMPLTIWPFF